MNKVEPKGILGNYFFFFFAKVFLIRNTFGMMLQYKKNHQIVMPIICEV